jgi:hypothetical protein
MMAGAGVEVTPAVSTPAAAQLPFSRKTFVSPIRMTQPAGFLKNHVFSLNCLVFNSRHLINLQPLAYAVDASSIQWIERSAGPYDILILTKK